jgi:hypothetical protein
MKGMIEMSITPLSNVDCFVVVVVVVVIIPVVGVPLELELVEELTTVP